MKNFLKSLIFLLSVLLLSGCAKYGKLNDGKCKGLIAFADVPQIISMMDEDLQKQVIINIELQNVVTQKQYKIVLKKQNDFQQKISITPGVYQVTSIETENSQNTGVTVVSNSEQIEFLPDREAYLSVFVKDEVALTRYWMETQPLPEILLADLFSGMIQVNRKIISISDIIPELDFSTEKNLDPNQKDVFVDTNRGISVTIQNKSDSPKFYDECEVIGITVDKNTVVFPEGVTIGKTASSVCHAETGTYGQPTSFKGSSLYGLDVTNTLAVYQDLSSKNRITITFDDSGNYVKSIQYELGVQE